MTDEIIATLEPTTARRGFAVGVIAALGAILLYLAVSSPPQSLVWLVFLVGLGLFALWGAERLFRATDKRLELTRTELREAGGRVLARVDEIQGVDRGAFAFKPSNGFLLKLRQPAERVWAPGLWWRFGRRVGVGGVTPGSAAKNMAEALAIMIADRDESA